MLIQLNEPAEKLLAEVQQLYGRPITLVAKKREKEFGGLSNILDDGTPYIQLNVAGTDLPCTLVHELFHLKHRAEGVASIFKLVYVEPIEPEWKEVIGLVFDSTREFVSHMRFYDQMEAMGYFPRRVFDDFLRMLLSKNPGEEIHHPIQRPLTVARIILEASDQALASEALSHFPDSVELGKLIASMAVGQPEECVVRIADRLMSDYWFRLELGGLEEQLKGQVVDRVIVVNISRGC